MSGTKRSPGSQPAPRRCSPVISRRAPGRAGRAACTRNRAPVVLIASQITSDEQGFDFPQEVDFAPIYKSCSVFCDEIRTPAQARRKTAMAAQAALAKRGVAVLIAPVDVASAVAPEEPDFAVHRARPGVRPDDAALSAIAAMLNAGGRVTIYGGSGCEGAHDAVVALAERLNAPVAHTSRAKDFLEPDNPFDVGMTGVFGLRSGYESVMKCDTLLLLGCDFAWRLFYPNKARIIQIDVDGSHLGRRHPVTLGAVGDVHDTLTALLPKIRQRSERHFLDAMLALRSKASESLGKRAAAGRGPIHPQYIATLVARHAQPDAIFTADGGA